MDIERLQKLAGIEYLEETSLFDMKRFTQERKPNPEAVQKVPPQVVKDMLAAAQKEFNKALKAKNADAVEAAFKRTEFLLTSAKILGTKGKTDILAMAIIFQRASQKKIKLPKSFDTFRKETAAKRRGELGMKPLEKF